MQTRIFEIIKKRYTGSKKDFIKLLGIKNQW